MPHFLIKSFDIKDNIVHLQNPDTVRHLTGALRIQTGEIVKFIDENKVQYEAEILNFSKKEVRAKVLKSAISKRELQYNLFLAQSILKTDAQNLLISNAVQLGIKGIYPFISDYSTVKGSIAKLKGEKWQKVADEAFKQCERADLMKVFEISPLADILGKFKKENVVVFAEKYDDTDILNAAKTLDINEDILVIIGPEGGFSENEFNFFKKEGYKMVTLGNLIFKAPNAVTAGVSNVIFALDIINRNKANKERANEG